MRIAIDGMGGDNAPQAVINGVIQALNEYNPIGKHTNLIERKEIRNISHVIFQILVVGFLNLHNTIFQFNEHEWHSIDEDKDIRSSVVDLTLNPHL